MNEEMAEAIAVSQPLRGVVSFGIMLPEELTAENREVQIIDIQKACK